VIPLVHPADGSIVDTAIEVDEGRRLVLYGPNGSGKTTMIRLLAGILPGGPALEAAYLPQHPYLFDGLVGWNLGLGLDAEAAALASQYVGRMGLADRLTDPVRVLSGGERARVALARTLARRDPVVLLDEPLAAVDAPDRLPIARLVVEAIGSRAAVIVTHDLTETVALGTHVAVVDEGDVIQTGTVAEVLSRPADDRVARATGVSNVLDGVVEEVSDGVVTVRSGDLAVVGHGEVPLGAPARVLFGAEAVTLYDGVTDAVGTARNHWASTVSELRPSGRLIEVHVDSGSPVVGLVTPGSAAGLDLRPGARVTVSVKAAAVTVVPA
jgi:molybdopterin-binding protein